MSAPSDDEVGSTHEALLHFLYQAPIGLLQTRRDGEIELANPAAVGLLMPLAPSGALHNLFDALATVAPQVHALCRQFDRPSGTIFEAMRVPLVVEPATGRPAVVLSLSVIALDASTLMAKIADVTAEVDSEHRSLATATAQARRVDPLTGLPNRAAFIERLNSSGRTGTGVLYLINVDRFKRFNHVYGQTGGDALLQSVARRLAETTSLIDTELPGPGVQSIAARLSGDEFVVMLDAVPDLAQADAIARRLQGAVAAPHAIGHGWVQLNTSIGIVFGFDSATEGDQVIDDASLAMREARRAGGSRSCVFSASMRDRARLRSALEIQLLHAIEKPELFVVYQPILALNSGQAHGVEALVRWNHPERGVVPPAEFIGLAEETGLIRELGYWVLQEACRQFQSWRRTMGSAAPRSLAVNLSSAQLGHPDFVEKVAALLHSLGMTPSCLHLELTESLAACDDAIGARLAELKRIGVSIALDDFGTGFSSLSSLHKLPVDVIKIDRSFVADATDNPHARVLIEAMLMVARSLELATIAEGVETPAQAALLQHLGCEQAQGFWYARPMTAAQTERYLLRLAESSRTTAEAVDEGAFTRPSIECASVEPSIRCAFAEPLTECESAGEPG